MSVRELLAAIIGLATAIAVVWIMVEGSVAREAIEHGLQQDADGHWKRDVSAETYSSSDFRFVEPPALPEPPPAPEADAPRELWLSEPHDPYPTIQSPRPAIYRVNQ